MGKRHEKGAIWTAAIIIVCLFLMYLLKDVSPNLAVKEQEAVRNISIVTNDIAMTDTMERDVLTAEQEDLWILFDYLIFARQESHVRTALFPAILIAYIVLIGPFVYFILKKREKMEWMWVIIPAASFVFAGGIMLFGSVFQVKEPLIDSLTVTTPEQNDIVYFTSASPKDEEFEIEYVEQVEQMLPIYEEKMAFSKDYIRLEVKGDKKGKVKSSLSLEDGCLVGTIENNTEWRFKHVMLCYDDCYCILPPVLSGEKIDVKKSDWKWIEDVYTGLGMEESMADKDCDRILKIAYLKFFEPDRTGEVQISAVIQNFEPSITNVKENLISYGLYQQWEEVK